MKSIELSDKSLQLIEKRRGDRSVDQYVNMVMENLYDRMSQVTVGGTDIFSILETRATQPAVTPVASSAARSAAAPGTGTSALTAAAVESKVLEIIKKLRVTYPGKIPYNLFYQECMESGISREDIEASAQKSRGLFQIQMNKDDDYAKLLLVIIYNYLKDIYSSSLSTSQFYGKCLEEGLTVDDIRFAESVWQISIPGGEVLKELATKTDAMGIENKLLKMLFAIKTEYPDTIPIAVLYNQCLQFGLAKEDIGQLEKIYTKYLLTKHNERISGENKPAAAVAAVTDVRSNIKTINTKIKKVIDEMVSVYGDNVPDMAFLDKCKSIGFTGEEQMYARKVFEDYLTSLTSYKEIKYMNNKAYIILTSLRKTYPGKIPYNTFYNKCKAIGMKTEEIADAIKQSGHMISTEKSDEEHYLKVLEGILLDYKKA